MTEREFETLVREHRSTIYTVCYMFSTDKDEVADLFVALNTCISQDRKKRRGLRTEPLSMDIDLFDEQAEDTRQFGLLRERIGKLGPFDRAIVLLWLENLSYEEIGQIVGITPGNVSVRLVRIKEQLKKMQ